MESLKITTNSIKSKKLPTDEKIDRPFRAALERQRDFRKEVEAAQVPAERRAAARPAGAVAKRLGVDHISCQESVLYRPD